jgi:diguanylate cyclase (GGDEF)-like protein
MKELPFLKLIISEKDHYIISADHEVYDALKSSDFASFDDHIHDDYKKIYQENLHNANNSWFPLLLMSDTENNLFCAKAKRKVIKGTDSIQIFLVKLDDIFTQYNYLSEAISTYNSQLELYDDVFFDYDPSAQTVSLANTQAANFDSGIYSIEEIEALLCQKLTPEKREKLRSFITQVKTKAGRFTTRIEENLLNDDPGIFASILEANYIFYSGKKEHVIGHIHLEHKRGSIHTTSLKRDSLTGLLDKSEITRIAKERIDDKRMEGTTLVIIDIDFFKRVNDTYGHQYGDKVIKRIADIIAEEVRNCGVAGRFGGDEFLVIFNNIHTEEELRNHFRRMYRTVWDVFADSKIDESKPISLSIGTATFSKDADNYEDLFMLADHCLYIAKEKGRNRYIIYTPEKHGSLQEIQQKAANKKILDDRGTSYGDVIVKMYNIVHHGGGATVESLMDEFVERFGLQRASLIIGTPYKHRYTASTVDTNEKGSPDVLLGVLNSDIKEKYLAGRDFVVVNRIDSLPPQAGAIKEFLKEIGVLSYILVRFNDRSGNECFFIISSLGKYVQWNELHFKYYMAFIDLLSFISLE